MKYLKAAVHVCLVLTLAACGGGGHLSVKNSGGGGQVMSRELVFPPGEPREYRLPQGSGGIPPYEYSIDEENCPDWVTLFPDQRILAGTAPAVASGQTFFCAYHVTESDPGFRPQRSVTHGLRLRVGPLEVPGDLIVSPPAKIDLSVGTFRDVEFPAATGGIGPYTYSLTCAGGALPSGMSFAPATRRLAGTPTARFQDSCTYSVMDSAAVAATVSQPGEVEVAGPVTGTLMLPLPNMVYLWVGTFDDELLPAATGGVQPYTYSLTCAGGSLPSGMSFAPATRRFAGTPGVRFRDSCTYSVTDSAAVAATVSQPVEVEVAGPVTGTLMLPASVVPGNVLRLRVGERARVTFRGANGGVQPYTYELICPDPSPIGPNVPSQLPPPGLPPYDGLGFGPQTRVLSGTPNAEYSGPDCTYRVTDSAMPPATLARSVALIVEPDRAKWRFAARSLAQHDQRLNRNNDAEPQEVYPLPEAMLEEDPQPQATDPVYRLLGIGPPLGFDPAPASRELQYEHPDADECDPEVRDPENGDPKVCDPDYGRTSTYLYQVLFGDTVDDTLCVDVSFRDEDENDPGDQLIASVRIHDNAYFDGTEFQCPSAPLQPASASFTGLSNPVHEALGPVHARRALDAAHGAVRDRVRAWRPGAPRVLTAITPTVGAGSLAGESEGFEYSGSSESASAGAELGSGSWQAGLIASFTRTDLRYRARARLAGQGYRAGDHDTEIFSLHPFAAWHMPSGGDVWASLGAGTGQLRHRDDHGFPSWSRSDVRLRAYAAGASVPVAEVLSGEVEAEAGVEAFAFEIEGGGRISSSLPTLRGRDWRAGVAWSAPVRGAPSLSVAYRHLTGDGPEGGQLETKGSVSVDGILDPRLSLIANIDGALGLGDHDHDSWGLSGGIRFAPGESRRGFGLDLDTRLVSPDGGGSADVGIQGEAGYGLRGWPPFPTVRPYVGVMRHSGDGSLRRSLGIDLRDTPGSRIGVEAYDRPRDRLRAIRFSLRHRF